VPSGRRRGLIRIGALACALALAAWTVSRSCGSHAADEANDHEPHGAHGLSTARDPNASAHDLLRWLAQRGVGLRRVAGVVLMDGKPVAGASVGLASKAAMTGGREPRVVSDENGRFDFGPQLATTYVVAAEMPHVTGAIETIDLRDPTRAPPPDQLQLVLHPCTASVHGKVTDTSQAPIAPARISRGDGDLAIGGVESSADGSYELCIPEGWTTLTVRAIGYAHVFDAITAFGPVRRDYTLVPDAAVVGRVVRTPDRAPVADAVVELHADPISTLTSPTLYARSDAEGRFHFDGAAPGRHTLVATAERLVTARPLTVIAEVGAVKKEITCLVEPAVTVAGKVVDRGSREPVAGLTITLRSNGAQGLLQHDAVSQNDGSFAIEHVLSGDYIAYTRSAGGRSQTSTIKVDKVDVNDILVEVDRGASIAGRVLRAGKPVDGADVSTDGANAVSGSDGRFVLRGLKAGEHTLYAESNREGAYTRGFKVVVAKDEQRNNVELALDLAGSIAGRVVDQDDAPVGNAVLRFSLLHTKDFGTATTADDGTFVARALSGGGLYVYEVHAEPGGIAYRPIAGKRFQGIAVRDGSDHVSGVLVRVRRDHLVVAGRVVTTTGQPVADVRLTAVDASSDPNRYAPDAQATTTDANGTFSLRDLASGTYTIRARAPNGAEVAQSVVAGTNDLVLHLPEVGQIDGTLEGLENAFEVFASSDNSGTWYSATITGATFRLRNVAAGAYVIGVRAPGGTGSARVVVEGGATATVVLRRRPTGTIVGTLVDGQTHAPIANASCYSSVQAASDGEFDSPYREASTAADGSYRIERAPTGDTKVRCHTAHMGAVGQVRVVADQANRVDLLADPAETHQRGYPGITFEDQLGEVMVRTVASGGPADRAGFVVGDIVLKIDGNAVGPMGSEFLNDPSAWWAGLSVTITVERGDVEMTLQLTVDAVP
jgi:uncharacterized GH25 family protein